MSRDPSSHAEKETWRKTNSNFHVSEWCFTYQTSWPRLRDRHLAVQTGVSSGVENRPVFFTTDSNCPVEHQSFFWGERIDRVDVSAKVINSGFNLNQIGVVCLVFFVSCFSWYKRKHMVQRDTLEMWMAILVFELKQESVFYVGMFTFKREMSNFFF